MPSVLFINRVYPPGRGATGRVLRELAQVFVAEGWTVNVLASGPKAGVERDGDVAVTRVKAPGSIGGVFGYLFVWMKLLFAVMRLPRYDLVISMTDPPMQILIGRVYARMRRSHHIHWCHDLYPDLLPSLGIRLPKPFSSWLKRVSRRSMKSCEKVIVIGRCMARQLAHTGVEMNRIAVIPNWPDFEILDPDVSAVGMPVVKAAMPAKRLLRDESPKFRILYAGNIGRAHPMKTVIEVAVLLSEYPEIEFVFVGDSPGHEKLARERDKRGLQNIKFLPFQPAPVLRTMLESGDVHLISLREQAAGMMVPSKFYSSLAVGRPCIYIGPKGTEIARVLEESQAGTIVPQGDADALSNAILAFRSDPDVWFAAQEAAAEAGRLYLPQNLIPLFLETARDAVDNKL